MSSARAAAAAALWLAFAAPFPAAAEPVPGAARYRGWDVAGFAVEGLDRETARLLADGLALAARSGLLGRDRATFTPDDLDKDLRRSRLFLARHGYPNARIEPRLRARGEGGVEVTFVVEPGPAVKIVEAAAPSVPPELAGDVRDGIEDLAGRRFEDQAVEDRRGLVLRELREKGYAEAEVVTDIAWRDTASLAVHYVAAPGVVYYFGRTHVAGVGGDLTDLCRRLSGIERGDRYSPSELERGETALRAADLFRKVRVDTRPAAGDTQDVVLDLAERDPRTLEIGLGYWTDDKLRVGADWKHRNLFREGRGFGASASYSLYLQAAGVSVWKPTLFRSRTRGQLGVKLRRESEETYRQLSADVEASATYLSVRTTLRPAASFSWIDLQEKTGVPGAFTETITTLLAFSLEWIRSTVDDPLSPNHGRIYRAYGEWGFPDFAAEKNYRLARAEGIAYLSPREQWVVAARLGLGLAGPMGSAAELLPSKRFFAGGASSMRGYQRRLLGPLDPERRPLGGIARLESALEARFPLHWRLRGAAFVDAGQVWFRRTDIQLGDLAVAAGPGLVMATPVGPVRADFGFRLTGDPADLPPWVFHLSIGHAF